MSALPFPAAVIDFEASSLSDESFPIEVGIAVAASAEAEIESWSALLRPPRDWAVAQDWSPASARVHGIPFGALADGLEASAILAELNRRVAPGAIVWCDGGAYDLHWFARLCAAARPLHPTFRLADLSLLFRLDRRAHNRFATALAAHPTAHRAEPDARRILSALLGRA